MRSRFPKSLDANEAPEDEQPGTSIAWSDLFKAPPTEFRDFLKMAGADLVGGREHFLALCRIAIHLGLDRLDDHVELGQALGELQGQLASSTSARAAVVEYASEHSSSFDPGDLGTLLELASSIGTADDRQRITKQLATDLWRKAPGRVLSYLHDEDRAPVAHVALAEASSASLVQALAAEGNVPLAVINARPDIARDARLWSIAGRWSSAALNSIQFDEPTQVATAILGSNSASALARLVRQRMGEEVAWHAFLDLSQHGVVPDAADVWLQDAVGADKLAAALRSDLKRHAAAAKAVALRTHPDFVPNDYGEDPWWTWVNGREAEMTAHLAGYLFARALGRRSRNQAELIGCSFWMLYTAAQASSLPDQIISILADRMAWVPFSARWDMCLRLRRTVIEVFAQRDLWAGAFLNLKCDDRVFEQMVWMANESWSGRRLLKSAKRAASNESDISSRLQVIDRALR